MTLTVIIAFWLGYIFGFGHARFSDYAKAHGMWPYNKSTEKTPIFVSTAKDLKAFYAKEPGYREPAIEAHNAFKHTLAEMPGPQVICKGPAVFERDCGDCGAAFTYTFVNTYKSKSGVLRFVKCPVCSHEEIHSA